SDWIRRLQTYGKERRRVFFTEFYADVEPPDDGTTTTRHIIASKTTCALGVQGQSEYYLLLWDKTWAMEWTERDMASVTPNPFMVSKTSPTVDFLIEMTPVWPPAPGAEVSGTDRSCPFGIALVRYDAKKHGPLHDSDATVRRPIPGQPYYRVDRTTRMAQFNGVNAAIREFFSAACERAALWVAALPPTVWALVFRREDRDNKASALSVPAQGVAADRLLAQASAALERMIDDPDQPGASGRAFEPPLTPQQVGESPGCVFQRLLPVPREVAACIADAYMSCLAPRPTRGTRGSMGALAEQIGKNLTPDCSDLFPRLGLRLAHEDKVKGSAAGGVTPVAKCAAAYKTPEGEVTTTDHAHWLHKFRTEIAAEAKLTLAAHEAGADLWGEKFLISLLGEAGQTAEPMAIMSLIHAARCGARVVFFGDERQLCPTVKSQQ
ncbi:unnamed protein product, partial [Prorocentrum cordatum]